MKLPVVTVLHSQDTIRKRLWALKDPTRHMSEVAWQLCILEGLAGPMYLTQSLELWAIPALALRRHFR